MNTNLTDNYEQTMARFMAAKRKKKEVIDQLEKTMKEEYEKRTGLKANYFFAMQFMVVLDIECLNSPYKIEKSNGDGMYKFITDFGVEYVIGFLPDDMIQVAESYEFIIANTNHKPSPGDHKVQETIMKFIDAFFTQNNFPVLYLCETSDGKQAMRNRLFQYWFSQYDKQADFMYLSSSIVDLEGVVNYATLIIKNNHPKLNDIVGEFTNTIQILKNKPL